MTDRQMQTNRQSQTDGTDVKGTANILQVLIRLTLTAYSGRH